MSSNLFFQRKNIKISKAFSQINFKKDFVIKDMIKDIKTLMAEYHEDATVIRNEK